MKFAFIIMGGFHPKYDRASIRKGAAQIIGVSNMAEAWVVARKCCEDGLDCIELCGAFGEAGAKKIIEATENKIPVGYVVHTPAQNELFHLLFGGQTEGK